MLAWIFSAASHPQGKRGLAATLSCLLCVLTSAYCVSASHSIVLMSALWITIFAFCSLLASLYSMSITNKPTQKFSYGLARVPVLAVFSTTVLAQLFSIFLSKESFEHLLSPDHHGSHDASAAHEHEAGAVGGWPYYFGALATSTALLLSAYALKNQPFQHVLTASSGSSLQEHAADLSHALCWAIPGLSRLLLPRINAMVLLAATTSSLLVLCDHFKHDFAWADPVCCLLLSVAVFSTMWPLSTYTGMILLQTTPPHLINQMDRCISEASTIDGVLELKTCRYWQLDFNQLSRKSAMHKQSKVGTVDVRVRRDADEQNVLALVTDKLSSVISILTVQVVKDAAWSTDQHGNSGIPNYSDHASLQHGPKQGDNHGHSHDTGSCDQGHGHSHEIIDHGHDDHHQDTNNYNYQPQQAPPAFVHHQQAYQPSYQSANNHGHSHDHAGHGHSHDGVTYH